MGDYCRHHYKSIPSTPPQHKPLVIFFTLESKVLTNVAPVTGFEMYVTEFFCFVVFIPSNHLSIGPVGLVEFIPTYHYIKHLLNISLLHQSHRNKNNVKSSSLHKNISPCSEIWSNQRVRSIAS